MVFFQPGGSLFITCPSRTIISRIVVVFLAELFNIIPKGTHDYNDFISTEDLTKMIENSNFINVIVFRLLLFAFSNVFFFVFTGKCVIRSVEGIFYNPFRKDFVISRNKSLFYGIHALKKE